MSPTLTGATFERPDTTASPWRIVTRFESSAGFFPGASIHLRRFKKFVSPSPWTAQSTHGNCRTSAPDKHDAAGPPRTTIRSGYRSFSILVAMATFGRTESHTEIPMMSAGITQRYSPSASGVKSPEFRSIAVSCSDAGMPSEASAVAT